MYSTVEFFKSPNSQVNCSVADLMWCVKGEMRKLMSWHTVTNMLFFYALYFSALMWGFPFNLCHKYILLFRNCFSELSLPKCCNYFSDFNDWGALSSLLLPKDSLLFKAYLETSFSYFFLDFVLSPPILKVIIIQSLFSSMSKLLICVTIK